MENPVIIGLGCMAAGVFSFALVYKFKTDETFARKYIETSPKAFIWRKMLGAEKALSLTHKVFAPIGFLLSSLLIISGLAFLILSYIK